MTSSKHRQASSEPLIEKDRLIEIVENAKQNTVRDELFGYLWELWGNYPEEYPEPPTVPSLDALTEVLRSFWERDLQHELLSDLLLLEEGEDSEHKLWESQPEQELEAPANLYQLVRKAWDQNRMGELIAMIEEYEDLIYGGSIREAIVDFLESNEESDNQETLVAEVR
jgi:hypothetical protein